MRSWRIENRVSGIVLGVYSGESEQEALDAMARDARYRDYAAACEVAPGEDLVVREVVERGDA
jgi:hypothetical protein